MGSFNKIKRSSTVVMIVVVMLASILFLFYEEYKDTYARERNIIESSEIAKTQLTKSIYHSLKRDSQQKTDMIAEELRKELLTIYQDDFNKFSKDYDSPREITPLILSINDVISKDDRRFFYVENDANDMFVASLSYIIYDKSLDCSAEVELRDFEEEIKKHYNKSLAREAIQSLIKGDNPDIFWQFKNTKGKSGPKIYKMDISEVLNLPLEDLADFEFLTVSYIDKYGDILGNDDVGIFGQKQDSKKILVVQGFNLYDQASKIYKEGYLRLEKDKKIQLRAIEENRNKAKNNMFSAFAIMLVSLLSLSNLQNMYVKGCARDDE